MGAPEVCSQVWRCLDSCGHRDSVTIAKLSSEVRMHVEISIEY